MVLFTIQLILKARLPCMQFVRGKHDADGDFGGDFKLQLFEAKLNNKRIIVSHLNPSFPPL